MSETSTDLVVLPSGEILSIDDWQGCARALKEIRYQESVQREVKGVLSRAIAEQAARLGTKTLELPDGSKAHVSSGTETEYDAEEIQNRLYEAGMPSERVHEIVSETVTYKVSAVEAKRAANANALYATIIDECSREVERPVTVSIRRS